MNNVFIGNKVDKNRKTGILKVTNGSSLTIEYSGEVLLDSGFEVEKGAAFELYKTKE